MKGKLHFSAAIGMIFCETFGGLVVPNHSLLDFKKKCFGQMLNTFGSGPEFVTNPRNIKRK